MKAELSKDGTLTIAPHTETEAYALRCWADRQKTRKNRSALCVKTDVEPTMTIYTGSTGTYSTMPIGTQISNTNGDCCP